MKKLLLFHFSTVVYVTIRLIVMKVIADCEEEKYYSLVSGHI